MESLHAKNGQELANTGIEELRQNRRDLAIDFFNSALDHFEAIEDDSERRMELVTYALLLIRIGFLDIALIAVQEALELDEKLGDRRQLGEDLVTCGNVLLRLGNNEEALSFYNQALEICKSNGDLDNAASASTNIAVIIGNNGEMTKAIHMMHESLNYLSKQSNSATEITTRIALVQAMEVEECWPEDIFAIARPITKYSNKLRLDQWDGLRVPLDKAINRYLKIHPNVNPNTVRLELLPGIF